MNSIWILFISALVLMLGYRYYGRFLSRKFSINNEEQTPALTCYDGRDYVPARHWTVLFGHHFASIAGAGPIVGPILACALWGWMPALLWILIGSIFFGGVHDFGALTLSIKHKGHSIADITKDVISSRARILFVFFVWLALVLVIAVFAQLCAKTLTSSPKIVVPSLGLIPLAIGIGFIMYRRTMNQTASTLTGLAVLLALIIAGTHLPISIESEGLWMVFLFLYCYAASIAPVHILLQPRDYLSSFLLFFGMFFGIIGILFVRPEFTVMPFTSFAPDRMNQLWPLLFVTVACGAISGFHSLVSSGTTAKQLDAQQNAVKIAYAGMLLEGGLAVLALICVGAGLSGADAVRSIVIDQNNPIGAFNAGYGSITRPFLGRYGSIFSATILNAFILTTLDTATRIGRYLTEELFNISNRYIATGIIVTAAGILAFSGSSTKIWPVFGASNQLVAALALMVLTCWLLGMHKNSLVVSIPAGIMLVTTISALIIQIINFYTEGQYVLLSINIVLIILAAFLVYETYLSIRSLKIKQAAAIP